jgi:polyphosphate kinase 2 (PPK2 family)
VQFDRSSHNRGRVERVMNFATEKQVGEFYYDVPDFERMLPGSGIKTFKYWFSITGQEQQRRFIIGILDPSEH